MATVPVLNNNIITYTGEDGIVRVELRVEPGSFQLIESSFVIAPPVVTPPEPELPSSVCPVCGDLDVNISDGHMICHECGTEATFGMTVEVTSMSELLEQTEGTASPGHVNIMNYTLSAEEIADLNNSNPCGEIKKKIYPIKKYEDIVGNIRNRFEILDL